MTDYGITGERQTHKPRESRLEFRFYFALIFMLTLPFTLIGWWRVRFCIGDFPKRGLWPGLGQRRVRLRQ